MAVSMVVSRIPSVSRSQLGLPADTQAFITDRHPKELIAAQGSPAAPLFPKTSTLAAAEPINVVSAAISTNPLPKFKELRSHDEDICRALFLYPFFSSFMVREYYKGGSNTL
jgi:hypothetical protein